MSLLIDPRPVGDPHPRPESPSADPSQPSEPHGDQVYCVILVVDERVINAPARVLSLAQTLGAHHRSGARVLCILQEHSESGLGRGRLWVGPRTDRPHASTAVTAALVAASLRNLGVGVTRVRLAGEAELPELPRIVQLLGAGTLVILSGPGAEPVELTHHLNARLLAFDPDARDRADRGHSRRPAATGGASEPDSARNGSAPAP